MFREAAVEIAGCYQFFSTPLSWTAAQAACQADGGQLAPARTLTEHTFLLSLSQNARFWIAAQVCMQSAVVSLTAAVERVCKLDGVVLG